MYKIFEELCKKCGITPYKFCKDMGVNSSTISTWKKNNSLARPDLAKKVCDYFDVSMDYLMNGKESSTEENKSKELKGVYFNFAKEMQEKNVSEADMQRLWDFYEMIQNARK